MCSMGDRQGCTSCHDGVDRNALNIGTELQQLYLKIVEQKTMPPASTLKGKVLSDQERMALYMNIVSSHVNEVK